MSILYKIVFYVYIYYSFFHNNYLTTNFTTEKYVKDTIDKNPLIFNNILIDEYNGVVNFEIDSKFQNEYNFTNYEIIISKTKDYSDILKNYLYNGRDFDDLNIYYNNKKTMSSWIIDFIIGASAVYFVMYFISKFIMNSIDLKDHPLLSDSKSSHFSVTTVDVKFSDVIGLESVKEDLKEYVGFIENREQYLKDGCKIPRGLMFTGPPGTGKTLLAKALAGETNASFIPVSGSDFIEMYVGVGSKRVKNLFELARKNLPCIIFIDEIDAIGKKRSSKTSFGGHDEQGNTLNKLLTEMDGFTDNQNILVVAATNMVDSLDTALTRSGRFDRKIIFDKPNKDERKKLFK